MNERFRIRRLVGVHAALLATGVLASGCPGFGGKVVEEAFPDGSPRPGHHGKNPAALRQVSACDDVLASFQERATAQVLARAEALRQGPEAYYGEPGVFVDSPLGADAVAVQAPREAGAGEAEQASASLSPGGSDGGPSVFSETTLQVADVDEADVIKADGDDVYLLQGNALLAVRAWPPESLEVSRALEIEGDPIEMFVHDGVALVYSWTYRDLRREAADPDVELPYDYYGYYDYYGSYVKVTLVDVSGDEPSATRELYFEGDYVSSRRRGDVVRSVLHDGYRTPSFDGFYVEYFTPFGTRYRQEDIDAQVDAWVERSMWAIGESELGDWLPRRYERIDGRPQELPFDCSQYLEPQGESRAGLTSIATLSLDSDAGDTVEATSVSGRAERVYMNDHAAVLAYTDYGSYLNDYAETSTLHLFELDGDDTRYVASGSLPGYVNDQFSLDERDGVVRVSTTENRWNVPVENGGGSKNRVWTLAPAGGWLDVWGQTEVFGNQEQIYATRFIGDRGYVVTFRQIDPLFVLDLSDPARPRVAGELELPGFSNYLFPLENNHLFAIGRDADEQGFTGNVALRIFDVSDPAAPSLAHSFVYDGEEYQSSYVDFDHRAISFARDDGRVAFPLQVYGENGTDSRLEVFDVSVSGGIQRLGAIRPPTRDLELRECLLLIGYSEEDIDGWLAEELEAEPGLEESFLYECTYYYRESMRRGLFREDVTYGISTGGIYAHRDLAQPAVGQVQLPPARYYYGYYYPSIGIMATAGAGGASMGVGGSAMGSFEDDEGFESGAGGGAMADGQGGAGSSDE